MGEAAESEGKALAIRVKAAQIERKKKDENRRVKEAAAKDKAFRDEKNKKIEIAAQKVARIKEATAKKVEKATKEQQKEAALEKKKKQAEKVKKEQRLQQKKDAEKQKYYKDMQKLYMQRVAEYKQADDVAKAIGLEVLNLKNQKAGLRAKLKQESSEHKRELLEKQIDSVDAGLDNAGT